MNLSPGRSPHSMISFTSLPPPKLSAPAAKNNDFVAVEFVIKYTKGTLPLMPRRTEDVKSTKPLALRDLYVYAFVTSAFMAYPEGPRVKSHDRIVGMNTQHQCKIVLDVLPVVPENTLLHICLVTPDHDEAQYHTTATTLARCQVDLKTIVEKKGGAVDAKCLDAYRFTEDVGTLSVSLSTDTSIDAKVSKRYRIPILEGVIERPSKSKWDRDMMEYVNANFDAVWKTYESNVWYPGPRHLHYAPIPSFEHLLTTEGPLPSLLFYVGACQMNIPHPEVFVDAMIRIGCLCAGVRPSSLDTMPDKQLLPVLCYAITALPRLLGYTYDMRATAHNQPLEADNIGLASMVCVELATLCHIITSAFRASKTPRSRLFHRLLNQVYDIAILSCTNRSVEADGSNTRESRHVVACLVPRTMLGDSKEDSVVGTWRPQLLDVMDNQDFDAVDTRQCPGMVATDEPSCLVGSLLPCQSTQKRIFVDVPLYHSAIKLYKVDDLSAIREYTFITDGKKAGMPMREFFASSTRLNEKQYTLICPVKLSSESECVKTAQSYWNETRRLSNVYMDEHTQACGLTDQKVDSLLATRKSAGWRYSFYAVGSGLSPQHPFASTQIPFKNQFMRQLDAEVADSNRRAAAQHQHNLHNIQSKVVGEYAIVGGVNAFLTLTTFEI